MRLIGVYGASGCGRGVMPLLRGQYGQDSAADFELVFIDDGQQSTGMNGHRVLDWGAFKKHPSVRKQICIAIADTRVRERIASQIEEAGIELLSVRAPNVVIMDDVAVGGGAILSPFVTLTSNIKIGRCFHANLYSYVEHDCTIGDFVTFAPRVCCNGNTVIEDQVYIGAGAILRQGTPDKPLVIGRGAVVGMGAVVTRSVPAGVTVVGNPARPVTTEA